MINGDGVRIVSTGKMKIETQAVKITCNPVVNGAITATGDIKATGSPE